ncbi:hypothetical protein tloyanaT_22060 [Thalassotalea loyana]|uniref:Uncharacterized protein n=1 Tax=Thalassotalea loyana TaxID=280483 RepID=A0ABQ6HEV3_9GAMM|nr:hypothetical protein tloyanaT_22060 [Thalassotalea loyana]
MISIISIFFITLLPAVILLVSSMLISWYEDNVVPLPTNP